MTAPEANVNRQAIRTFIEQQRGVLEFAQANGTLARTKLDLKDAAESAFLGIPAELSGKFNTVFDQELEAFCADLRLATVTVQHQVERELPKNSGMGIIIGAVIAAVIGGIAFVVIVSAATGRLH